MKTTLNKIRSHSPCSEGWNKLLKGLNKTKADDEEVSIIQIIESNGLDDAIWCLRAVEGHDKEIRLFAVFCARQCEHLLTDERSINAINVAERFANGLASESELEEAWSAAAMSAESAAYSAAMSAAAYSAAESAAESEQEAQLRLICKQCEEK